MSELQVSEELAALRSELKGLNRRVASLERGRGGVRGLAALSVAALAAALVLGGPRSGETRTAARGPMTIQAPFQVVDRAGKPIFRVGVDPDSLTGGRRNAMQFFAAPTSRAQARGPRLFQVEALPVGGLMRLYDGNETVVAALAPAPDDLSERSIRPALSMATMPLRGLTIMDTAGRIRTQVGAVPEGGVVRTNDGSSALGTSMGYLFRDQELGDIGVQVFDVEAKTLGELTRSGNVGRLRLNDASGGTLFEAP